MQRPPCQASRPRQAALNLHTRRMPKSRKKPAGKAAMTAEMTTAEAVAKEKTVEVTQSRSGYGVARIRS